MGATVVLAIAVVFGVGALGATAIGVRAANSKLASLEPSRHRVARPPGDAWLASASDVTFTTPSGLALHGWRSASTNGAAILLVHGSAADRSQMLPEARILSAAGYGVLSFDMPGHGESEGRKGRGDERDGLRAAIDALTSSSDVDAKRIGAYGFSRGAAFLADMAARDPRLRAVVLAGCYADTETHIRDDYRHWGPLSQWPALWAARWAGLVWLQPLQDVRAIGPRALFLIAGDADTVVSPDTARRLYAAASEPKELWIVPGAGHGGYADVAGEAYARRLVAFFDRSLL